MTSTTLILSPSHPLIHLSTFPPFHLRPTRDTGHHHLNSLLPALPLPLKIIGESNHNPQTSIHPNQQSFHTYIPYQTTHLQRRSPKDPRSLHSTIFSLDLLVFLVVYFTLHLSFLTTHSLLFVLSAVSSRPIVLEAFSPSPSPWRPRPFSTFPKLLLHALVCYLDFRFPFRQIQLFTNCRNVAHSSIDLLPFVQKKRFDYL